MIWIQLLAARCWLPDRRIDEVLQRGIDDKKSGAIRSQADRGSSLRRPLPHAQTDTGRETPPPSTFSQTAPKYARWKNYSSRILTAVLPVAKAKLPRLFVF
jgi:hypothetical protein